MEHLPLEGFVFPERRQWRRQVAALPRGMQDKLAEVVDQLLQSTQLPKGSGHEAYTGWPNLYSVRLSRSYRFVYRVEDDGSGRAVAVGTHDQVTLALKRA